MKQLAFTIGPYNVQPPNGVPQGGLTSGKTSGVSIIQVIISLLLFSAILLSLFYVVIGGFKWMNSGGDKAKLESARMTIIYAIIGLFIALFAFLVINIISAVIGVNLLLIQAV